MPNKGSQRPAASVRRANSQRGRTQAVEVFIKRDFLSKRELRGLTKYVLTHEQDFAASTVIPDGVPDAETDVSYRKSRVLYDLGEYGALVQKRLLALLPEVLKTFRRDEFPIANVDVQITASNDGDFFKVHRDNSSVEPLDIPLREVTYVYYFHTEPKAFSGGQLSLYNSKDGEVENSGEQSVKTITPRQNTLVLFPSSYDHEVLPVRCPTGKFADSRFTVNGWVIREEVADNEPDKADNVQPADQSDMSWLVEAAQALQAKQPPATSKIYLTLEEAAQFSGLSLGYLRGLIEADKLNAVDDGGWKVRRKDVERL
ncbi:MAG TPA: 2OG-Fe(II) oxygenase [Pyrinomonadaceae bacterium]|jgi:Rps23 Pro-64 3,4-dihydroxylase Tpa1-like proline 4-hydroxylase|nr:2OG-Fe(II) oxygenase [Pyrinomonadaceae bacterium]